MPSLPVRLSSVVAASSLALLVAPLVPVAAAGSFTWTQASTSNAPSARYSHGMVYDSTRGVTVLFGGDAISDGHQNDTWAWDGTTWTQIQTPVSPAARQNHALAYDAARGRVVLFGGETQVNGAGLVQDTWEFDGSTWTQASPAVAPSARMVHTMTYDTVRKVTLLFGGA